jgi:hypothetical protein
MIKLEDLENSELIYKSLFAALCINGFFSLGYLSLCYVHVISITPKIGESISCGIVNTLTNFFGCLNLISFAILYKEQPDRMSNLGLFHQFYFFLMVAAVLFYFIPDKRKLKRANSVNE